MTPEERSAFAVRCKEIGNRAFKVTKSGTARHGSSGRQIAGLGVGLRHAGLSGGAPILGTSSADSESCKNSKEAKSHRPTPRFRSMCPTTMKCSPSRGWTMVDKSS